MSLLSLSGLLKHLSRSSKFARKVP